MPAESLPASEVVLTSFNEKLDIISNHVHYIQVDTANLVDMAPLVAGVQRVCAK
jgi:hypothetical protein